MDEIPDYLVLGSGLSGLAFSSLAAKSGKKVKILEAHEHFGGYGHTFNVGDDFRFNAQFHYVISCGQGDTVNVFLKRLELEKEIVFHRLSEEGYDRIFYNNTTFSMPYRLENLEEKLIGTYPLASQSIKKFVAILKAYRKVVEIFPMNFGELSFLKSIPQIGTFLKYYSYTLQQVFDQCQLPKALQTLLGSQMINYMLPPKDLSFFAFALLFNGYTKGAYYPEKHYEHVIQTLVKTIERHDGALYPNEQVISFIVEGGTVRGVKTKSVDPKTGISYGPTKTHYGKTIICNFDPKSAAKMIGLNNFSYKVQKALDYDYSWSSFVLYGVVKGLNLRDYGFGNWNIWHCPDDLNEVIDAIYYKNDYSKPYFAMNCPSYFSPNKDHCLRESCLKFEVVTLANYSYWRELKLRDHRVYNRRKQEVLDSILDVIEKNYVPNIRDHLLLKMTGSPTSSERYVWAPEGGSYGVSLTPRNLAFSRKLDSETSLKNFYFCSAASGYAGFAGTIYTGMKLYDKLFKDHSTTHIVTAKNIMGD